MERLGGDAWYWWSRDGIHWEPKWVDHKPGNYGQADAHYVKDAEGVTVALDTIGGVWGGRCLGEPSPRRLEDWPCMAAEYDQKAARELVGQPDFAELEDDAFYDRFLGRVWTAYGVYTLSRIRSAFIVGEARDIRKRVAEALERELLRWVLTE